MYNELIKRGKEENRNLIKGFDRNNPPEGYVKPFRGPPGHNNGRNELSRFGWPWLDKEEDYEREERGKKEEIEKEEEDREIYFMRESLEETVIEKCMNKTLGPSISYKERDEKFKEILERENIDFVYLEGVVNKKQVEKRFRIMEGRENGKIGEICRETKECSRGLHKKEQCIYREYEEKLWPKRRII